MKEEATTDALLRQFLLGKVDDEERERIESLFLTDSMMRERVLAVEHDLVEDYLEDSLSAGDKEKFLLHYAQTPEQQRKLRITKSIKDWAVTESASEVRSPWNRFVEGFRARPVFVLPIAAVIILAVVFAVIWLNRRAEQRRHLAIEQEVAQLNDPARRVSSARETLTLRPGTLRSSDSPSELKLRSDVPIVELRLLWLRSESYPAYRAVLRRFEDDETITIPNLQLETGKSIPVLLPSHFLRRGIYQLHLTGLTATGSSSETEEYQFTVGGQ